MNHTHKMQYTSSVFFQPPHRCLATSPTCGVCAIKCLLSQGLEWSWRGERDWDTDTEKHRDRFFSAARTPPHPRFLKDARIWTNKNFMCRKEVCLSFSKLLFLCLWWEQNRLCKFLRSPLKKYLEISGTSFTVLTDLWCYFLLTVTSIQHECSFKKELISSTVKKLWTRGSQSSDPLVQIAQPPLSTDRRSQESSKWWPPLRWLLLRSMLDLTLLLTHRNYNVLEAYCFVKHWTCLIHALRSNLWGKTVNSSWAIVWRTKQKLWFALTFMFRL